MSGYWVFIDGFHVSPLQFTPNFFLQLLNICLNVPIISISTVNCKYVNTGYILTLDTTLHHDIHSLRSAANKITWCLQAQGDVCRPKVTSASPRSVRRWMKHFSEQNSAWHFHTFAAILCEWLTFTHTRVAGLYI